MDFAEKVQFFTLDVITDIAFGEAFGYLERDEDRYAFIEKTKESLPAMIFLGVFPWVRNLILESVRINDRKLSPPKKINHSLTANSIQLNNILHSPLFRRMIPSDKDPAGLGKLMR